MDVKQQKFTHLATPIGDEDPFGDGKSNKARVKTEVKINGI